VVRTRAAHFAPTVGFAGLLRSLGALRLVRVGGIGRVGLIFGSILGRAHRYPRISTLLQHHVDAGYEAP
jgi:hypothetical protein